MMKGQDMMKFSPIASLLVAGALIAPLAVQAQDKPASPAKVWVKDSVVTTKIKTLLAAEKMSSLALVHVETDANGLVQLSGTVSSQADKDKAEQIARGVDGVKLVDNQLMIAAK